MSNILLSGYYGYNNAGDEAILKSIINNIKQIDKDAVITVLSDNVEFTKKKYSINATKRFNPFSILASLLSCDILISGGGTLFQDKTSTRSLVYYTSIINFAKFFGKKVMIYANGIGPLNKPKNRKRVKKAIENADIITLRDQEALDTVKSLGVDRKNIYLTTDPVFCLQEDESGSVNEILEKSGISIGDRFVLLSVRNWENKGKFIDIFAKTADYINTKYKQKVIFLPLQFPHDVSVIKEIRSKMQSKSVIIQDISPMQMMSIIKKADYVFAMRLHALIFAANMGTPMISYSYDSKVDNLMNQIKMPYNCSLEKSTLQDILDTIDKVENNLSGIKEDLIENTRLIKQKSQENLDFMRQIFSL
ncbi:MAG: polysaccharide pyruvyl transferase CsaB [Peptostreptococcaceae bacterium]|nr:polysaccharide pyruvyl transferase CsaB [uncultured Criibacterium sp.]MBS6063254.1 polysaccharide pyruvyl transferase CsaB [Peptostreptococcaceae bacterium]